MGGRWGHGLVAHNMPDTSLIGRAKELQVAAALIRNGVYVYYPLVDTGADLIAANRAGTLFVPVQVKFRTTDPALCLLKRDMERFENSNTVIAFLIGAGEFSKAWYLPYSKWKSRKVDRKRRDGKVYVRLDAENKTWLSQFEGDDGVRHTFRALLS